MRIRILLAVITTLALPSTLEAQGQQRGSRSQDSVLRRGPVELLLRNRSELALSAAQVTRLEEIERRMDLQNQPLIARLVEIRRGVQGQPRPARGSPEHREANRRRMEEAKPLMDQIRRNNHAAMQAVGEVLTPAQKVQVRELIEARRQERERNGPRDQRRRRRG